MLSGSGDMLVEACKGHASDVFNAVRRWQEIAVGMGMTARLDAVSRDEGTMIT